MRYEVTWTYRGRSVTEDIKAPSPGEARAKAIRRVARRFNAPRRDIIVTNVAEVP